MPPARFEPTAWPAEAGHGAEIVDGEASNSAGPPLSGEPKRPGAKEKVEELGTIVPLLRRVAPDPQRRMRVGYRRDHRGMAARNGRGWHRRRDSPGCRTAAPSSQLLAPEDGTLKKRL